MPRWLNGYSTLYSNKNELVAKSPAVSRRKPSAEIVIGRVSIGYCGRY